MIDLLYKGDIEEGLWNYIGALPEIQKLVYTAYLERGQLYGALIKLMIDMEVTEMELSTEDRKTIHEDYYILFSPNEDGKTLRITLQETNKKDNEQLNTNGREDI